MWQSKVQEVGSACADSIGRQPCGLRNLTTPEGGIYSCVGACCIPWYAIRFCALCFLANFECRDEAHQRHECDDVTCPMTCQLCKRLCAMAGHFHGLDANAVHLCG
jgi:hypothetical protein